MATVQELKPEIPPSRLALGLAPLSNPNDAFLLAHRKDGGRFVEGYDYERGRLLLQAAMKQAGRPLPKLALVGSLQPIDSPGATPDALTVASLCREPNAVAETMAKFSNGLLVAPSEGGAAGLGDILRRVFDSLGSLFNMGSALTGDAAAAAAKDCPP